MSEYLDDKNGYYDYISGLVLLVFSSIVIIYGLYILKTAQVAGGMDWYTSPALFPIFIGLVLLILSILLIISKYKFKKIHLRSRNSNNKNVSLFDLKNNEMARLIVLFLLLIVYIFVLIGRIHFALATFLYLFFNMIIFREKDFSVIKITIISAVASLVIYYGFNNVAKIPLP